MRQPKASAAGAPGPGVSARAVKDILTIIAIAIQGSSTQRDLTRIILSFFLSCGLQTQVNAVLQAIVCSAGNLTLSLNHSITPLKHQNHLNLHRRKRRL
jgi:hypothetical protein